jgi:predicted NACHT family NTPase
MEFTAGLTKIIEQSFISVFQSLSSSVELNREYKKIIKGSEKYANWIVENFAQVPLFATKRVEPINNIHVSLAFSTDVRREHYKSIEEVEQELSAPKTIRTGSSIEQIIEKAFEYNNTSIIRGDENKEDKFKLGNRHKNKEERAKIDNSIEKEWRDIAILGVAGSGKTTTLKYLTMIAAQGSELRGQKRVPFYFSLRDLEIKKHCLIDNMAMFLEEMGLNNGKKLANLCIRKGVALVLIDGIDEENQKLVINEITSIKRIQPDNPSKRSIICLSGRPYSLYRGLVGFDKCDVIELSSSQKQDLIRNWFGQDNNNKSCKLWEKINNDRNLNSLSSNPLLLSIICALYYYEHEVPKRADETFRLCLEGLMGRWDRFRDVTRYTPLNAISITRRITLLKELSARTMLSKKRKIVFSADDIEIQEYCEWIVKKFSNLSDIDPQNILDTLYNDFGVLVERSNGIFSFSHLQFQEYLVAQWILDQREELQFTETLPADWQELASVTEHIAKGLSNPFNFLHSISNNINLDSESKVSYWHTLITDPEIMLEDEQRKELALNAVSLLDRIRKSFRGSFYVSDTTLVAIADPGINLFQFTADMDIAARLVKMISDIFPCVTEELQEKTGNLYISGSIPPRIFEAKTFNQVQDRRLGINTTISNES